ncbi:MAG: DNA primase DnaG [Candidatus Woesearchaeota archaeon]
MAKISPISAKYIIHSTIQIDGVVDKPDVIGAVFGQTEGLLGADLELRELQKSGRIGRIEVNTETKVGKTSGEIIIPSSMDKAETAIIGASLEIIQRIGPCNAKLRVTSIEDVRISKRQFVVERAKELLKELIQGVLPDSQELADEVAHSVRVMEVQEYGPEKLAAGPGVEESDEIIVVEGRADVLNLLKHGFKNAICVNGTSVPKTIARLSKEKTVTVFVDGDRGGDLIIQELLATSEIDFITKAPDGKEVEELTQKEIHKALRGRIAAEQFKLEFKDRPQRPDNRPPQRPESREQPRDQRENRDTRDSRPSRDPRDRRERDRPERAPRPEMPPQLGSKEKEQFKTMLDDLVGTRGAFILDDKLNILGKVPGSELVPTIKSLNTGIFAVVYDGSVDRDLVAAAERAEVKFIVGADVKAKGTAVIVLAPEQLV